MIFTDPGTYNPGNPDPSYIFALAPDGAASVLIAFPEAGVSERRRGRGRRIDRSGTNPTPATSRRRRPDGTIEDLGRMPGDNPVLDGMKVGADGRLYVTDLVADGIHVLAPDGKVLDFIPTGGAPTNIAFDGETLWVTNAGVLAASTEPSTAGTIQRLRIPGGGAPTYKGVIRGSAHMSERDAFPGLSYKGMTCFVTGGGSGIGLETALTFADLGGDVAVLDRTPGAAAATAGRIESLGRRALAIEGDAGDENDGCRRFRRRPAQQLGPVDVAVACAGVLGEGGPVFTTSVADFEQVMGVNVRGSFLLVREAAKQMRPRRSGAIVLLSSLDGTMAEHGMFSYCVSKGALLNMARAAALDLARDGVRVNCVCPSVTRTPLLEGRLAQIPNGDEVLRAYAERHPLGRVLTPRDIAAAIAFIASPIATGITGVALPVDAGIGATWDNFRDPAWFSQLLTDGRCQSSADRPPSTR